MPVCQGCNASYDESFAFCPYCGSAKPETPKIKLEVDLPRKQTPEDCPKCDNDLHTQIVSSIYASGTTTGIGYTEGSGTSNYYQTYDGKRIGTSRSSSSSSSFSVNQSQLAKNFIPPNKPIKSESGCAVILGIITFVASGLLTGWIIFDLMYLQGFLSTTAIVFSFIGLFILIYGASIYSIMALTKGENAKKDEEFENKMVIYEKAMFVWEHLYYCHKHDIVFLEGQKDYFPVKQTLEACYILGNELNIIDLSDSKLPSCCYGKLASEI